MHRPRGADVAGKAEAAARSVRLRDRRARRRGKRKQTALVSTFLMKMIIVYVKKEALEIIRNIVVALLRNIRKET